MRESFRRIPPFQSKLISPIKIQTTKAEHRTMTIALDILMFPGI